MLNKLVCSCRMHLMIVNEEFDIWHCQLVITFCINNPQIITEDLGTGMFRDTSQFGRKIVIMQPNWLRVRISTLKGRKRAQRHCGRRRVVCWVFHTEGRGRQISPRAEWIVSLNAKTPKFLEVPAKVRKHVNFQFASCYQTLWLMIFRIGCFYFWILTRRKTTTIRSHF